MKSAQTIDPLNKFAKAMKKITGKRAKTDADYLEIRRLDFMGALYVNQNGPCVPSDLVVATLIAGAKKSRKGLLAKSGTCAQGTFDLVYAGPRDPDELFDNENFQDVRSVRIGTKRIMRCRPKFQDWETTVIVNFNDERCNASEVEQWLVTAGQQCGIGDYRPRFGRFSVEELYGRVRFDTVWCGLVCSSSVS